jgi:hypothetical protein
MNLYFKTSLPAMKPHHREAYERNESKAHQEQPENHIGNYMHRAAIVAVQQATRRGESAPEATNSTANKPNFNERNEFLALIKVLFRLLKDNQETSCLHQAKKIIAECALRNRNGNANFALWKHNVDHRLRAVVGDAYWCQAQRYVDGYKYRRGLLTPSVAAK